MAQLLGFYDPDSFIAHVPLNVLWVLSVVANGICFGCYAESRRQMNLALAFVLTILLPVATANAVFYLVFPHYISSDSSVWHKGFVVGFVVPTSFFFSQFTTRQCCLSLIGSGRHPGCVGRLFVFAAVLESFARRALLCGVQDLRLMCLSSVALGLTDTLAQLSVDLRDGLIFAASCRQMDEGFFEHPGRRRLRADSLLLHFVCEHLAISTLSSLAILVQLVNLHRTLHSVIWSLAGFFMQTAVRLIFDVIVFTLEGRVGCLARSLFRLERWHGIPVQEVWWKCRQDMLCFSVHVSLIVAVYGQFFFKSFFEKSLLLSFSSCDSDCGHELTE
ncbi:unnamed protein product [Effrenium voratum]|nr:unnamed protein product [Effrenium voratum]